MNLIQESALLIGSTVLYDRNNPDEPSLKDKNGILRNYEQLLEGLTSDNDVFGDDVLEPSIRLLIAGECLPVFQTLSRRFCYHQKCKAKSWLEHIQLRTPESNAELSLCLFIASLQLFIQQNFTGPLPEESPLSHLLLKEFSTTQRSTDIQKYLLPTGEDIYKLTRCPELLVMAKCLLERLKASDTIFLTLEWWEFRYLRLLTSLFSDHSYNTFRAMISLADHTLECFRTHSAKLGTSSYLTLLNAEVSLVCSKFGDISLARKYLNQSIESSGLDISLTGAMGVRTRFQQTPYSQLVVRAKKQAKEDSLIEPHPIDSLPQDLTLDNETLLPRISFLDVQEDSSCSLRVEEQIVILAISVEAQKSSAIDEQFKEKLSAYVEALLMQTETLWGIRFNGLFLRSRLEKQNMKKVERAMTQVQALVDLVNVEKAGKGERLDLFYNLDLPTFWSLEKELAHLLISLGAIKGALDVFLRLELWEEVVFCYKQLQRNDKAEAVVREQLSLRETPTLWCLLGDVTNDPKCYEQAWCLSEGRSFRAQRSLGYHFFKQKKYAACIPYFQRAAEISSLDQLVWFSLGHACTETGDYQQATRCYRRVTDLDPDSFEAWNNLSNAYIKMDQKLRAYKTFREALKCSYENWKIWENFLLVCVDVGAFEEAIQAWHRLIDIKGKHLDEEVLEILTCAILEDLLDLHQRGAASLLGKALVLLGHITASLTNSSKTWFCYGQLQGMKAEAGNDLEATEKMVQCYQKAYRCAIQKPKWEKDAGETFQAMKCAQMAVQGLKKRWEMQENPVETARLKQISKLMLQSLLAIVGKQAEQMTYGGRQEEILKSLEGLRGCLEEATA